MLGRRLISHYLRAAVISLTIMGTPTCGEARQQAEPASTARDKDTDEKRALKSPEDPESEKTSAFFRLGVQPAYVLPTTEFVQGENRSREPIEWGFAQRAELGWETSGSEDWHHLYRFPSYGVGVYAVSFGTNELGSPVGVYGFFSWPFASLSPRVVLSTDLGFGVTFGWEPFDPETNPYNRAVGSSTTFAIDWALFVRYFLTPRVDVFAGVSLTHFSNGSLRAPNAGLNTLGPVAGIQYRFADRPPQRERRPTPKLISRWGMAIWGAGGAKSVEVPSDDPDLEGTTTRQRFGVANLGSTVLYRLHPMSTLRAGVDLSHDGSANAPLAASSVTKRGVGLYAGYQQEIAQFSILLDLGYYTWRGGNDQYPAAYQRLGLDYRFFKNLFAGIHVRFVDFQRADFVEWSVGYRFDWRRRQPPSE